MIYAWYDFRPQKEIENEKTELNRMHEAYVFDLKSKKERTRSAQKNQYTFLPDRNYSGEHANDFNALLHRINQFNGNGILFIRGYKNIEQLDQPFKVNQVLVIIYPKTSFQTLGNIISILANKPTIEYVHFVLPSKRVNEEELDCQSSDMPTIDWKVLVRALSGNTCITHFELALDVDENVDKKHVYEIYKKTMIQKCVFRRFSYDFSELPLDGRNIPSRT